MFKGIFVDDEDDVYAAMMTSPGKLEFERFEVQPITDQVIAIRNADPMVVALDYRLDEVLTNVTADHSYKGSGLAQLLRDKAVAEPDKDCAIALVSAEAKLKQLYAPDKTAHDLFDVVYSKEEVTENTGSVKLQLLDLAYAYAALRKSNGEYNFADILATGDDDDHVFESQELRYGFEKADAPHIAIRHLLRNIIERNGLLLDAASVSATLGIDPDSLHDMAPILEEKQISYRGLLSKGWPRWWGHRLDIFCNEVFETRSIALTAGERSKILKERLGVAVSPCKSTWNGSTDHHPSFACASCHRPADMAHSLAAFDPRAPRFSDPKRICWDCIQTDRYRDLDSPLSVDETDASLVSGIRTRDRSAQ